MDYNKRIVVFKEVRDIFREKKTLTHTFELISTFYLWSSNLTVREPFSKTALVVGLTVLLLQLGHCRSYAGRQLIAP